MAADGGGDEAQPLAEALGHGLVAAQADGVLGPAGHPPGLEGPGQLLAAALGQIPQGGDGVDGHQVLVQVVGGHGPAPGGPPPQGLQLVQPGVRHRPDQGLPALSGGEGGLQGLHVGGQTALVLPEQALIGGPAKLPGQGPVLLHQITQILGQRRRIQRCRRFRLLRSLHPGAAVGAEAGVQALGDSHRPAAAGTVDSVIHRWSSRCLWRASARK